MILNLQIVFGLGQKGFKRLKLKIFPNTNQTSNAKFGIKF